MTFIHIAAALALVSSTQAAPLQPTGKWIVNYDDAQCVAMRNYGTEKVPLYLVLKPSPQGSVMRLIVMQDGRTGDTIPVDGKIAIDGGQPKRTGFIRYYDEKSGTRSVAANLPMSEFKASINMSRLSIRADFIRQDFAVSGLAPLTTALETCLTDLRKLWNTPPEHGADIAQSAVPEKPLNQYVGPNDYPMDAWSRSLSGTARFTLLIDLDGAVRDCSIEQTSGIASLDTMSCYTFSSRAKFKPALGPDGKPVRSSFNSAISWRMQ